MKNILFLLLLISCYVSSTAQSIDSVATQQKQISFPSIDDVKAEKKIKDTTYRNQLKYTMLRTIDPFNPGVEFSYERLIAKNFSLQFSYAYMTDIIVKTYDKSYKGHRFALEGKYFIAPEADFKPYVAVELAYLKSSATYSLSFAPRDSSIFEREALSYSDTIGVSRQTVTANLKFGVQVPVKHLIFDFSAGFGIKYIDTRHSDRLNPQDITYWGRHPSPYNLLFKEGKRYVLNLPFNIRVGCTF